MAVIRWPAEFGYEEYSEKPERSRGPYVHRSAFTGAVHVSYGGGRRRRGYVVTPVEKRSGAVQPAITALVQQLSDPANQLRLKPPRPIADGVPAADDLIVHVTRIQPPERDDRGVWRGWRLEFVTVGTGDSDLPDPVEPVSPLVCPPFTGATLIAKTDDTGFDVSIPVTQALVDETTRTDPADSEITKLRYQLYSGATAPALMTSLDSATELTLSALTAGTPITFAITEAVTAGTNYSVQAQWVRADDTACPIAVVATVQVDAVPDLDVQLPASAFAIDTEGSIQGIEWRDTTGLFAPPAGVWDSTSGLLQLWVLTGVGTTFGGMRKGNLWIGSSEALDGTLLDDYRIRMTVGDVDVDFASGGNAVTTFRQNRAPNQIKGFASSDSDETAALAALAASLASDGTAVALRLRMYARGAG